MANNSDIQIIVEGFLSYLKEQGKEHLLPDILSSLSIWSSQADRSSVVYSASELPDSAKKEIDQILLKSHGVDSVEFRLDRDLIGGLKILIGNQVLDLSYKNKLEQLTGD